jgi:hypothetical protein
MRLYAAALLLASLRPVATPAGRPQRQAGLQSLRESLGPPALAPGERAGKAAADDWEGGS